MILFYITHHCLITALLTLNFAMSLNEYLVLTATILRLKQQQRVNLSTAINIFNEENILL